MRKAIAKPCSSCTPPIPNLSVVTSIASILQNQNPQNPHCESLKEFSSHLTPTFVIHVIKNLKNPHHALSFFNWASNPKPNPNNYSHTPSCYAAITDLLLSHSLFSTAFSFLRHSNKLSDSLIFRFINALGQRGDIRGAIHWFHKAKTFTRGRYLFSCNAILGVLVKANRINLAQAIYDQVVAEGVVELDVCTYTTMIRGFCKMGMVESANKVFDEMRCGPNMFTYNTLIHGLCKKGYMEGAKKVFNRLVESESCKPDVVTFTTLIDGYSKKGELREALKCMEEMVERGCCPNVVTYNALIEGLCLCGNVDEAKRMMTRMRLNGLKDNVATNTSILKGFCIVGKSDDAINHFKGMISRGMNPDVKAYSVIVNEYCKIRKPSEAVSLLREMVIRGIKPSMSSFNAVFRVLVDKEELEEVVLLLKQMPRMGCTPNFLSYSIVVCSLCKVKGKMQQVEELVGNMLQNGHNLDATMYNCLLAGYCEDEDEEMALKTVYDMIDKNFVINHDTFCTFVKELCAKEKVKEAERVLEEMCRRYPVSDVNAYRMVLRQLGGNAEGLRFRNPPFLLLHQLS
ncbi:pentatricopeptide repeat-containing protein At5g41170, mitochondrial-like [Abrus precatorius]|uniref:Pentatricopeptide repeat-containing protein At5g41170, mitochondrial-like n=1 Tax=Abrus precatorius TaxID=3816 RepID=A0A8B8LKK2_ABRPR|nr:pentatricopeptide repeat-containing protein At5g41170, mitochondrial-like [Abrus precatorius]